MHAHTHVHTYIHTHTRDISQETDLGGTEGLEGCTCIRLKHSMEETILNCLKIKMKNKQR